jgi:23S rRNA (cytidine1920-2'-O)/16S rRNA (cytidine1409-2'-O)-methyltransferase
MVDYFLPLIPPSRAALKLAKGLEHFQVSLEGKICADFGANSGGFTAVMLNAGAKKVYAIETGYGVLDWKLRNEPKVIMLERTNALFVELAEKVDFISIDTSWTKQIKILPSAVKNLAVNGEIITLVKPHYEADPKQIKKGQLQEIYLLEILDLVEKDIKSLNLEIVDKIQSPITGKSAKNIEWIYFLKVIK